MTVMDNVVLDGAEASRSTLCRDPGGGAPAVLQNVHLVVPRASTFTLFIRGMNNVGVDVLERSRCTLCRDPLPYPAAVDVRRRERGARGERQGRLGREEDDRPSRPTSISLCFEVESDVSH